MNTSAVAIFFHNYYGHHAEWLNYFKKTIRFDACLYYNINEDSIYNIQENDPAAFNAFGAQPDHSIQQLLVRSSSNMGKDIGGKLVLLDSYLRLAGNSEYCLFLHDKKSPYKANAEAWKNNLFAIAEEDFSSKALQLFSRQPNAGIITANGNVKDEYDYDRQAFSSNNRLLLPALQQAYEIHPPSFHYVTGTMFWCRMQPLVNFFTRHSPLSVRSQLEKGNVIDDFEGSHTHAWERLLCWLVTAQQYAIKTI
ncbi:MAG TPA: rhamnan synthesis F family protein [Chitinophagaceae bacterium]|nr:rhamnan synthesis F family protein [Chitinophagaceae bacterium]